MSYSIDPGKYPRLAAAVDAVAAGRPVLLLDDSDRENEADIVCAARNMTVDTMVKMIRDGSGIVCLCLDGASTDRLGLEQMVRDNQARNRTGFTVTIEAREGVTTGVSAADRLATIRAALGSLDQASLDDEKIGESQIVSPGHVFPLRARDGGVLERRGHTEGSLDLAVLAGMGPAAVLCELMNDDGSMARDADIRAYSERHGMPMLTIEEIAVFLRSRAEKCA